MAADEQPTDEMHVGIEGRAPAALAEVPLFAPGRTLGDRYVLERRLGHGGMAVVWLATDQRLDRPVAIKVLSDTLTADHDYRGRFGREARLAAGLQHPNLVQVYDYDAGERPWLVMEYVEGGDLAARIRDGRPPAAEQLAHELLAALRHIHAAGVLHRDIKPQNVLVDRYGHARLTDFGIARPSDAESLTRTGHVVGTERYLAPEVLRGEPASERSDLYALGVVLAAVAGEGAGAALWQLTDELRDPDPEGRPTSASAALAQLERGESLPLAGETTQPHVVRAEPDPGDPAPPPGFAPTPADGPGPGRRRHLLAIGALVAVVIGLVAALALAGGGDDPSREPGGAARAGKDDAGRGRSASAEPSSTTQTTTQTTTAAAAAAGDSTPAAGPGPGAGADGAALNDQGFALVSDGDYAGAIPVLERAVASLRRSGDETTYNYALFNLAGAYLGAGRPQEAIPLLEERMQFDDGQLGEVQAALDRAYAESGQAPPADSPAGATKPGKGPKGGVVPPPFQGGEDSD